MKFRKKMIGVLGNLKKSGEKNLSKQESNRLKKNRENKGVQKKCLPFR